MGKKNIEHRSHALRSSLYTSAWMLLQPEGLPAISRGLSEATPPVAMRKKEADPGGVAANQPKIPAAFGKRRECRVYVRFAQESLRPLRGRCLCDLASGGVADAQPPANRYNPFGVPQSLQQLVYNDERSAWECSPHRSCNA